MPPAARETPDVNGHHVKGRHPGRHHVETGPGPIGPGGSGRSDHLRHTVPVSRARTLRNSPLRQSGPRNGWLLQPGRPRSIPPSQPRHGPNRLPPARDFRRAPASNHPVPDPPKRGARFCPAASSQQRLARSTGAPPNSPASVSFVYGGCRLSCRGTPRYE